MSSVWKAPKIIVSRDDTSKSKTKERKKKIVRKQEIREDKIKKKRRKGSFRHLLQTNLCFMPLSRFFSEESEKHLIRHRVTSSVFLFVVFLNYYSFYFLFLILLIR